MDYIKALNEVYNKHYVDEGKCKCFKECRSTISCNYPSMSYRAKVGNKYGNNDFPKIMFIGQESPRPSDSENRAVLFPATCSPCTMKDAGYNQHYLRTFYTLARLIENSDNRPKSHLKDDIKEYEYLTEYLCLTNFYKCVFSDSFKRTKIEHSNEMEKNCTKILLDEIKALSPDVIILQGKHPTFWNHENIEYTPKTTECVLSKGKRFYLGLHEMSYNGQSFYIIDSYHPSFRYWAAEEVLNKFCEILDKVKEQLDKNNVR